MIAVFYLNIFYNVIYSCNANLNFQHYYFSVAWSIHYSYLTLYQKKCNVENKCCLIFFGTTILVFQDFLTNRKCIPLKYKSSICSDILLLILRFINYFLNNLMYPCYINFVLLIEKTVYPLNTIYQYLVRFILIIMYYLGINCFSVGFTGECLR